MTIPYHEKNKAEYSLEEVKKLIKQKKAKATYNARVGANELGIDDEQMWFILSNLDPASFHKSMTDKTTGNKFYLDVYKPIVDGRRLYIKFTIRHNILFILSSFKKQ